MPDTRRLLRPEAEPRSWKDLTEPQRKAILRLHELLEELLQQPPRSKDVPKGPLAPLQLPNIDPHRVSNVFLLDGGRGSGKTSVLVTLLNLWQELLERDNDQLSLFHIQAGVAASKAAADGQADKLRELLRARGPLMGRLLPLPILDLQPLPSSTTLLMWLASRLNELVRALVQASGAEDCDENRRASWLSRGETELASRKAWREFLQVAALGSDGNLAARKGQLDPSAYAEELEETELGRIEITQRWHRLIEALQKDLHARYPRLKNDVRLVIPLDDADLNPQRCMELLDLVRTLLHPGVIFLLAGDSELFRKVLRGQYVRTLLGPVSHLPLDDASSEVKALLERDPTPRALANALYDKVVPPGHRLALGKLSPIERLVRLEPLLKEFDTTKWRHPGDKGLRPRTLAEYFRLDSMAQEGLPGSIRPLQDLGQRLLDLQRTQTESTETAAGFQALWGNAVEEVSNQKSDEAGRTLSSVFETTSHGRLAVRTPYRSSWHWRRLGTVSVASHSLRLGTASHRSIAMTSREGPLELQDRPGALFLIGEDLSEERSELGSDEDPMLDRGLLSKAVVSSPDYDIGGQWFEFSWPLPAWTTALDSMLFFRAWESWVQPLCDKRRDGARPTESDSEWLALAFVRLVSAVALDRIVSEKPPEYPATQPADWVALWKELFGRPELNSPLMRLSQRQFAFCDWVQSRGALLAAPESGLPAEVANRLVEGWLEVANHAYRASAVRAREQRVALAVLTPLNTSHEPSAFPQDVARAGQHILAELDKYYGDHKWHRLLLEEAQDHAPIPQTLIEALSQVLVVSPPSSTAHSWETLWNYLGLIGEQYNLSRGDARWQAALRTCLRRHAGTPGAAPIALRELWLLAGEHVVNVDREAVARWSAELERFGRQPTQFPLQLTVKTTPSEWDERWSIELPHIVEYQPPSGMDPRLSATLALAHEVLVDEQDIPGVDMEEAEAVPPFWLCALGVRYYGDVLQITWPLPRWQALTDRLSIWKALNPVVEKVRQYVDGDASTRQKAIDGLLYAFLRQVVEERDRKRAGSFGRQNEGLLLSLTSDDWRLLAERLHHLQSPRDRNGYRYRASLRWLENECALWATPETGLSPKAAEPFLTSLLNRFEIVRRNFSNEAQLQGKEYEGLFIKSSRDQLLQSWRTARRNRLQRVISAAGRQIQVDTLLGWIQKTNPDHPWYEIVGA